MILVLAALFAAAQVADFATYHPSYELNPIVLSAGGSSVWLKVLLVTFVTAESIALIATGKYRRVVPIILALGAIAGLFGMATNLMSRG